MSNTLLEAARKLSQAERILLVEQIWDTIAETGSAPDLTPAQKTELSRRIRRLEETGPQGLPWEEVKRTLRGKS